MSTQKTPSTINVSFEIEKVYLGIGLIVAVLFAMIAFAILPNEGTGANIVGKNIIPYIYTQKQQEHLATQCYQEEKRFGKILTAETNCQESSK